jgi:hypothetical protein
MVTIDLTTLAAKPRLSDPDVRDAYEQTSSDAVETALGAETKAIEAKWATDLADVKRALADHADELATHKTALAAQKDVNADLYKRLTSLEQSLVSRTTLAVVDREIAHAFCDALGVTPLDRLSNVLKLSEAQNHCHLHIYNRINVALHRVRNKLNKIAHPTEVDPALIFDELAKVMKEVDLNFLKKRVQCGQGSNADGAVSTSNLRK